MDAHCTTNLELQLGLPSIDDLTPLNQSLITPEIASAFGITPTNCSTKCPTESCETLRLFPEKRRVEETSGDDDSGGDESGSSNRAVKRPRLVWTPQLHKRFVDVIDELGVDKAVPKTIMEMMSVDGLTRENVASHLQKYRLYLKKAEGGPSEQGNSNSSPISISSTSTGGRGSNSSPYECSNGGLFGSLPLSLPLPLPLPLPSSGMHFNPMAMMPSPPPELFRYGVGQMSGSGSGKVGFCGMESGGFGSSMFWSRRGG